MREPLYPIEAVSRTTGLEEGTIRFLEKEFGRFFEFTEIAPLKREFNLRQITILRRISQLWQEEGLSLDSIKSRLLAHQSRTARDVWTIAVTSGKGGVGKTSIVTNLSIALAERGLKTVVLDADLGLANTHVAMGLDPRYTLYDLLQQDVCIEDIVLEGPGGVRLIPGGSGVFGLAELDEGKRDYIVGELKKISASADVLLIDTAAGISANVIRFLDLADDVIVTATPNIMSLLDAYGVIKTMYEENITTPVNVLVNMARSAAQAREVYTKIDQCSRQFLKWDLQYAGHVKKDLNIDRAIQLRRPLLQAYAQSPASKCIRSIAGRLAEKAAAGKHTE
ncbi:MAG: P-loop NTPase, partial [Deltaproteobacteria bacterium]|nr:P-loop NTPase [Deltaproteobacteria bacterium]